MKATDNPRAPHNQPFQLKVEKKISKKSRWNPSSPSYFAAKKNK
jgi:hypothetical protein